MLLGEHIVNNFLNPLPPLPLLIRVRLRPAGGIRRRPVPHALELRARLGAVPDPAAIAGALHIARNVGQHFFVAVKIRDVALGADAGEQTPQEEGEVAAAGGVRGARVADGDEGLHASEGASVFGAEQKEQAAAPDVGAEDGAGTGGEEGTWVVAGGGVSWVIACTAGENIGCVEGCRDAVVHCRGTDDIWAEGGDVVAVEEEAGVLEVDNRSEGAGVEVLVGFGVELRWEGCEAGVEMEFEGFEGR